MRKSLAKAWLTKLEDECIANANKTWAKIKKAFKAAFTPYDAAVQAQVALASLNQDQKNPSEFDKYISSFSLLSIQSRITDYHTLSEWFLRGLDPQIVVQLTLLGAVKVSTTMEELYSKASEIEGGYCHITSLRRGPQPLLGKKYPDSAGARRVMRSSGRLTRTVALVKSKYKTLSSLSCLGWSLMRDSGRTGRRTVITPGQKPWVYILVVHICTCILVLLYKG